MQIRLVVLILLSLLLTSCKGSADVTGTPSQSAMGSPAAIASSTSAQAASNQPVGAAATATVHTSSTLDPSPTLIGLREGFQPPEGWFKTSLDDAETHAILFTNQDTRILLEDEGSNEMPADFAAGALVTSPFPADGDPQALREGLSANLDRYSAQDIESLLVVADRFGLINLAALQEIQFLQAETAMLAQLDALRLEGSLFFEEEQQVHIQIWLTWTDTMFVSLFELSNEDYWPAARSEFEAMRSTMVLP